MRSLSPAIAAMVPDLIYRNAGVAVVGKVRWAATRQSGAGVNR